MFQSLTGSIHTLSIGQLLLLPVPVSIPHRFNSHGYITKRSNYALTFQSLTGSIHTGPKWSHFKSFYTVSIPHRFNSHFYC